MQEFINPKSMLTPGVAGAFMMFLVNGISFQFPEVPNRYLGIFLSFVIGAIVWFSETEGKSIVLQKVIYWFLNSLIIFVVGFGTANLAADAAAGASKTGIPHAKLISPVSIAFAGDPVKGTPPSGSAKRQADITKSSSSQSPEALREQHTNDRAEIDSLKKQLEALQQTKAVPMQPESKTQFFKRW